MPLQDIQFSGAKLFRPTAFTVANNVFTFVPFTQVLYDTDGYTNVAADALAAPVAGVYNMQAAVRWVVNTTGDRVVSIVRSRTNRVIAEYARAGLDMLLYGHQLAGADAFLEQGELARVRVIQVSGGNLGIVSALDYTPTFSIRLLGVISDTFRR